MHFPGKFISNLLPLLPLSLGDTLAARALPILPRVGGRRHPDRGQ